MTSDIAKAAGSSVYDLIAARVRVQPDAPALRCGQTLLSYAEMKARADAIAAEFHARGLRRGDRVAIVSENRLEYTLVQIACARLGVIAACQNWRLAPDELRYCIALVAPGLIAVSPRFAEAVEAIAGDIPVADIASLGQGHDEAPPSCAEPEDGLLIIYTSGTTGRPKAAVISHRAEIARMAALRLDLGLAPGDGFVSWAPMFHMGGTEHLLATLMSGGPGVIVDGFDTQAIVAALVEFPIGWLILVPATLEPLIDVLKSQKPAIKGVRVVGCMADLVPAAVMAEITRLLDAPFLDTFGATETGMPPLSAGLIPPGQAPARLPKKQSILTELRLCGPDGRDVPEGEAGEAWMRGPTLFSGYWNAPEANAEAFSGGWFHMGDLFRRMPDGYEFVGRSKYLIKSGGENIYPAEIERVLLADPRVAEAIVVRKPDPHWGEVPVAVIARADPDLDEDAVIALCRAHLASYKRPKAVLFLQPTDFPRNVSGKILREAVEAMV